MSRLSKPTFELSSKRRALLERRLDEEGVDSPLTRTISKRTDNGTCPLSFAQQRLWLLALICPIIFSFTAL